MTISWLRLSVSLPTHPKSDFLEVALNTPRAWTYVIELWCWASQARPHGNLDGLPASMIAKRAGWTGDADRFVDALRSTGWIDEDDCLSGWWETYGGLLEKADSDAARKRESRGAGPKPVRRTSSGPTRAALPDGAGRLEKRREEERREEGESAVPAPPAPPVVAFAEPEVLSATFADRQLERARGAVVADNRNARNGKTAESEAINGRPQTVEALLAHVVDGEPLERTWSKRFAALDGRAGRPTIAEKVAVLWEASTGKRWGINGAVVIAWFVSRLGEDNDKHRRAWERDGGATSSTSGTHPLWATWRAERDRGDVPPFEDWLRKRDDDDGTRSVRPKSTGSGGTPRTVSAVIADANAEAAAVWADSKAFEGGLALMKAATKSKATTKTTTEVAGG
jgi:hypothetical protein